MQSSFLDWCMPWFWALKPARLGSDSTYPCPGQLGPPCSWMFLDVLWEICPQMLGFLSCQSGCNPSILSVFIYQSVEKGLPADFLQFSSKVPTILDITYTHTLTHTSKYIYIIYTPVVSHKALAEVSKLGHYRRGELLPCMDGRANPLMDRKVVGAVLFGVIAMVAVVTSPTTAGCSVV